MRTKNSNKSEFVTFMGVNFPKVSNFNDLTVKHVRQYQDGAFKLLKSIPDMSVTFNSNWECKVKYADKDSEVTCNVSDKVRIGVRTDLKSKSLVFELHAMNITKEITIPFKVLRALISLIAGCLILVVNIHKQISAFKSSSLVSGFVKTFKGIKVKVSEEESMNSSISIKTNNEDSLPKWVKRFPMKLESKKSDSNKVHAVGKIDVSKLGIHQSKSEWEFRLNDRRMERELRYTTALRIIKTAIGSKDEIELQGTRIDIPIQDKLRSWYRSEVAIALIDVCEYHDWSFECYGASDKGVYIITDKATHLFNVLKGVKN